MGVGHEKPMLCRTVGVRLGAGESLHDILSSSKQVAEGVTTAGQAMRDSMHEWQCCNQHKSMVSMQ